MVVGMGETEQEIVEEDTYCSNNAGYLSIKLKHNIELLVFIHEMKIK